MHSLLRVYHTYYITFCPSDQSGIACSPREPGLTDPRLSKAFGGLEGRSPPSAIRIQRPVRRIRKPRVARFPDAVFRTGPCRARGKRRRFAKGRRRRAFLTRKRAGFAGSQTVEKPFRVVWRAAALQMQSESGDLCGGFGTLAVQGFLALFPAREAQGPRGKQR